MEAVLEVVDAGDFWYSLMLYCFGRTLQQQSGLSCADGKVGDGEDDFVFFPKLNSALKDAARLRRPSVKRRRRVRRPLGGLLAVVDSSSMVVLVKFESKLWAVL